ncbi:MAG: prephenate dehydrogenase/arogenate dehydrogenase family protein [Fimbriimonadales bacterium]|nr:prephenate dehydrogenase/arogenate dehydrogenase family protein [Fimbriimonadales bacterium]
MRVSIIGLGGIGTSIGLAYQHAELGDLVLGYDVDSEAVWGALALGAIDQPVDSADACADADLIIVATPPQAVPELFRRLAPRLCPETVVTDVVSVKLPVLEWAHASLRHPNRFVGGHPIAGTEQHGYRSARADLFQGAQWVITPTPETDADAVERVERLIRTVRAVPVRMDAAQHDREFALLSFMPHCLAFSLTMLHAENPTLLSGGGSWRSATRVAQSNPELWTELFWLNREATAEWLDALTERLQAISDALRMEDRARLRALLPLARKPS